MNNQKLYFIYTIDFEKNYFLSEINNVIYKTFKYKETCLYTQDELPNVKNVLNKERLSYNIERAITYNNPPPYFKLNQNTKLNFLTTN